MVRHILSDGQVLDSVKGIVIPTTGPTAAAYRLIAEFHKRRSKITQEPKEENKEAGCLEKEREYRDES